MTGHLVMTTLHANDGLNILERLEIEGVSAGYWPIRSC
nr:hypothetical protein [Candidatus Hamiltonella defensa]